MRIRTLLLSGVVFGSVTMLSAASWAQMAPKIIYNPQGEWAVTRVAAKGPGKEPYCTMARRFTDNVILTFARNAKEEASLAMDFQPNTLAKGQSYYVTLATGANEKRAFDVIPVSDKAMVIRLGQDPAFHNALAQSGKLDIDVAGLQFEFNVPDMAKGHQDMSGCVTSIVEPAAGEPMQQAQAVAVGKPAPEAVLMAPASKVTSPQIPAPVMHDAQLGEMEALREENMRLKSALERERREYEDRFMKEGSGSSQVSEVMEKLKLLEKENGDLKYQLADARSMANAKPAAPATPSCPAVSDNTAQAAELSLLREENARLKADIASQKTAMIELEMKSKSVSAGDDKKSALDMATITRLQSRVDELMSQNSELQSSLMSAQAAASTASAAPAGETISLSQLRSVEQQLRLVETERDTLRSQIEKMNAGKEETLVNLSGSDWNLEQATRRYNEAEREIRRLGTQLEQSRAKCTAEKKDIEYMLFDPEIATQEQISKLMTLETELNAAKAELSRKDTEVSERISSYEQQITALQGQVEVEKSAVSNQMSLEVARAIAEKNDVTQRLSQVESEKMALEQKLAAAIQPAAGAPYEGADNISIERDVAVPRAVDVVSVDPVSTERRAGYVSAREEGIAGQPIALAPKSAVSADSFVPTEDIVAPVVAQALPVAQKVVQNTNLVTAEALSGLLRQAGVALSSDVTKVEKASGPAQVAYSWDASGLFGSAEQKTMDRPEQFQTMVNQYLEKTKARCNGDFAASPVPAADVAGMQVSSYEIACISPEGNGATAALVFYGQNGLFTTVAHEAGMDTMDMAMDARDRVISSLTVSKVTR